MIATAEPGPEADFVLRHPRGLVISAYDLEQAGEAYAAFAAGTLGKI
ncbi:hypothetical protein [Streptomyces sp. A1-5]|nr:hypothetical protein [Streptomyces sp. A1-5]UJB39504.1 hypothetical protein HRD51_00030 [Streptomyces sp. A1-5]